MPLTILKEFLASLLISIGFSIQFRIKGRLLVPAIFGSSLGWTLCFLYNEIWGNIFIANFIAGCFVAIWSESFSRILKTPSTSFLILGVIPLVPGRGIYLTFLNIVEGNGASAIKSGNETLGIALIIALAILIINSLFILFKQVFYPSNS